MKVKEQSLDMVNGPIVRNMFLFAVPLMVSNLLQIAFNAADTIVVGKFSGQMALAAVGSTGSIVNLLSALFIGLSTGANIVIARMIGRGEHEQISASVHTSYFLALMGGLLMTVLGMSCSHLFLHFMNTPENIISLSTLYMRLYFVGSIPLCVYNFGSAVLRSKGDTQRPTLYLLLSGVINVLLNLLFVIVFQMSVAGVALATVISETVSAILVTVSLVKDEGMLHLDLKKIRADWYLCGEILRIGIPAGLQSMMWSISNVAVQSGINSFGSEVVAGNSAAANIEGFVYIGMGAFSQGCITFTSQNYGAGLKKRVLQIFKISLLLITITSFVVGFTAWYFGDFFLRFYTNDMAVIEAGKIRLLYVVLPLFMNAILDIPASSMRGMGSSTVPTVVMLVGIVCVRLVYLSTIWQMNPTLEVLYLCFPISWVITMVLQFVFWLSTYRRMQVAD